MHLLFLIACTYSECKRLSCILCKETEKKREKIWSKFYLSHDWFLVPELTAESLLFDHDVEFLNDRSFDRISGLYGL